MASVPGQGNPITLVAGADLSTLKFRVVRLNSSGEVVAMSAITDIPYGILQNAPVAGEPASVIPLGAGHSKVALGATLSPGARISSGATGLILAAASTAYPIGTLIDGGANGEVGVANLTPMTVQA
jgi:hypothetical protein